MELTRENCVKIMAEFGLKCNNLSYKNFGDGHINDTFLVEIADNNGGLKKYVLQAVNTNVFKNIRAIMENISRVTEHLKSKLTENGRILNFLSASDGNTFHIDESGNFWRIYEFIDDSICLQLPESLGDFYECAVAFGRFQHDLADFPADSLHEIIPDFHNTPKRYENFLSALDKDICGRVAESLPEIEFLKDRSSFYSVLYDSYNDGKLPIRVSHNDTKCNNVLLDLKTRKALCVIDLDTIMPGFSVNDFGDSIRFGASTAAEDETDLSKVNFDFDKFCTYTDGFLDGCGGLLTDEEIMLLPEGAKMQTLECGMRFLTDYLSGDTYFKINRVKQNLDRCRTQLKLVAEMEKRWDDMKAYVSKYTKK